MQYKQYLDSENVVLFLYMPPSTHQSVGAQDNWFKLYMGSMVVGTDSFPSENAS